MESYLLTIGIPTYNRKKKLEHCLELISKHEDIEKVEVLISDNASTDGTEDFLIEYVSQKSNRRYIRNAENLGFDRNILTLYKEARGKYIWYFSDDDEMLPGAIKRILTILQEQKPDVLYPNQTDSKGIKNISDGNFLDVLQYFPTGQGVRVKTDVAFPINSSVERLTLVRVSGFISCCLTRVDKSLVQKLGEYVGSGMLQTGITSLVLLGKGRHGYFCEIPNVIAGDKDSFSSWFMDSSLYGMSQLHYSKALKYPTELARVVCLNTAKFALLVVAQQKRLGVPVDFMLTKKEINRLRYTFKQDFIFLLPFMGLAVLGKYTPRILVTAFFSTGYFFMKSVYSVKNRIQL